MKVHLTIVLLFFTGFLFSQDIQEKIIEGFIRNNNNLSIEGIHVLNNSNGEATITNSDGRFKIRASLKDEIVFSGIQFARKKIIVNEELYDAILLNIFLDEFVNELDEVIVTSSGLSGNILDDMRNSGISDQYNFDDVGIPGFTGVRKERIFSDREVLTKFLLMPLTGGMDLDLIYKAMTGYYDMKRKEIKYLSQLNTADRIITFYGEKYFIDEFNLEENKIHDFVSSAVQNYPLYDNFKAGNHSIVLEYLKKNFKRLNN